MTTPRTAPARASEFLDQFQRVDSYAEIDEMLRSPAFAQGSHFESRPVYGGSLVTVDGPEHRERRKMLMGLFTHAALRRNETDILAPAIRQAFDALRGARSADGLVRLDLVALLRSLTIAISAHVTGVDNADEPQRRAQLQSLVGRLEAASGVEWSTRDKTEVMAEGIAARRELIRDFLQPALQRRTSLVQAIKLGQSPDSALPMDLLSLLARHGEDGRPDEQARIWRECALFLVAGTQTTSHALPHILWHLDRWWTAHPQHRGRSEDIEFLRGAANESLRLHQPVPALLRVATRDIVLESSGRSFRNGERIALFFSNANRDPALFGDDVESFNPMRASGRKPPPWGLSFGSGAHTCIGRALVTGLSQRYDDTNPTLGSIVGVLQALYQAGVALDPEHAPQRNTTSYHDAFAIMPIVLHHL